MKLKNFKIDQKVTFCNRDHTKKEFVSGEGTIEKLLKDHFGHKYAEIRQEVEIDGNLQVMTHVVPVAAINATPKSLDKFKRCIVRYEEADEKFRSVERKRFEDLIESIFTKAIEERIQLFKVKQGKRVVEYNRVLGTLRRYALGSPTKESSEFPKDVVEAAIDAEVRQEVKGKAVEVFNQN